MGFVQIPNMLTFLSNKKLLLCSWFEQNLKAPGQNKFNRGVDPSAGILGTV